MKKFNLKRALAGDPVITRNGLKVTHIVHFHSMPNRNLIWAVCGEHGINYSHINGRLYDNDRDSDYDLFMAPVKKKVFIKVAKNAYEGRYGTTCAYENIGDLPAFDNNYQIVEIEIEV